MTAPPLASGGGGSRILLVGGGHAHLEVLRRFRLERLPGARVTLISAYAEHHYSGMVPGYLQGTYTEEQIRFDLPALTAAVGGEFVLGRAVGLDPAARTVALEDGGRLAYDLVSFGIGSTPRRSLEPEVAKHASVVKPMSRAVKLRRALLDAAAGGDLIRIAVVGGGGAGVEVALSMAEVLDEARRPREITLLEGAGSILSGYGDPLRRRTEDVLASRSIRVRKNAPVSNVERDRVLLESGESVGSDLTVWLTGAVAYPVFRTSGLAVDERGFLLLDDSLRSVSDPRVFAAGDCGTLANFPDTPKAGVYAVRQGPVLWKSLRAAVSGAEPPRYRPQGGFLSILNTGGGKALVRYKGLVSHSRWGWHLKDWIDRRFMDRYKRVARG